MNPLEALLEAAAGPASTTAREAPMNPLEALLEAAAGPASTTASEAPVSSKEAEEFAKQFAEDVRENVKVRFLRFPRSVFEHAKEHGICLDDKLHGTEHFICMCPWGRRGHRLNDCNFHFNPRRHCNCKTEIPFQERKICRNCSPWKFCFLHDRRQCPYGCHTDKKGTRSSRKDDPDAAERKKRKRQKLTAIDVLTDMRRESAS